MMFSKLTGKELTYKFLFFLLIVSIWFSDLINMNSIIFILIVIDWIHTLIHDPNKIINLKKVFWDKHVLIFISLYFLSITSLTYHYNESDELKSQYFIRDISILLLPIIVCYNSLIGRIIKAELIYKAILTSCILIFVCYLSLSFLEQFNEKNTLFPLDLEYFIRSRETKFFYTHFHPTYIGILFSFSILLAILRIQRREKKWTNGLIVLSNFGFLFLINSKTALISLVLILLVYTFIKVPVKKTLKVAIFILFGVVIFNYTLKSSTYQNNSFNSIQNDKTHYKWNSINLRVITWTSSKKIIYENTFLGVGKQNVNEQRKKMYQSLKINDFPTEYLNLNSHNQYMEYFLSFGIIGFLWFIIVLFSGLIKFHFDIEYLFLILLIGLFCLTESILERQQGILFYAVLNSLLFFKKSDES